MKRPRGGFNTITGSSLRAGIVVAGFSFLFSEKNALPHMFTRYSRALMPMYVKIIYTRHYPYICRLCGRDATYATKRPGKARSTYEIYSYVFGQLHGVKCNVVFSVSRDAAVFLKFLSRVSRFASRIVKIDSTYVARKARVGRTGKSGVILRTAILLWSI